MPEFKDKEICICAAVKASNGMIVIGHRHGHAIRIIGETPGLEYEQSKKSQGFITSRNRYVDREEGLQLQLEAGIKSKSSMGYTNELYSEDLY